ncbi:related to KIP1-kinesin-related protein [Sporisorium scitamineum]|uniref:Related to KIP1-kinesin-related protein n=1 Tax=Sporisorium scitamineum TaxID=49012 RepID=A0A127Z327_9BASI|nr:related to KIP1-kinesin-related protein [Sporisorium scitamineum]
MTSINLHPTVRHLATIRTKIASACRHKAAQPVNHQRAACIKAASFVERALSFRTSAQRTASSSSAPSDDASAVHSSELPPSPNHDDDEHTTEKAVSDAPALLPPNRVDASVKLLEERLTSLQEEMRAVRDSESSIRAELELTRQKYKESLAEINDLNTQLTEVKLNGGVSSHPPNPTRSNLTKTLATTSSSRCSIRRETRIGHHRLQDAAATSSSKTPSPSNRLSRHSSGSFLGYNKSDGTGSMALSLLAHGRTRSNSQSSSLDFASALPSQLFHDSPANYERKAASLEKETMRLQEALQDRDEEIQALETSLASWSKALPAALAPTRTRTQMLNDLMRSMARKETQHRETVESMSARAVSAAKAKTRRSRPLSRDLVASMSLEIEELRLGKTTTSTRAAAALPTNSTPLRQLKKIQAADAARAEVQRLKQEHATAIDSLEQQHKVSIEQLAQQHAESLAMMQSSASSRSIPGGFSGEDENSHAETLAQAQRDHAQELVKVKEEANIALAKALEAQAAQHQSVVAEHEATLASISRAHDESMQALLDSHSKGLQEVKMELEAQHLSAASEAAREAETASVAKHTAALQKLQQEHAFTVSQMTEQLTSLKAEHESTLDKLKAEHASKLDRSLLDLQIVSSDRDESRRAYEELHAKHQDLLAKVDIDPHEVDTLRAELNDTSDALVTLEAALTEVQEERDQLLIEIEMMRQESEAAQQLQDNLDRFRMEATCAMRPHPALPIAALKRKLEPHKSMLSKTRGDMTKLKAELQAGARRLRLATSETRLMRSNGSGSFGQHSQSEHDAAIAANCRYGRRLAHQRSPLLDQQQTCRRTMIRPNTTLDLRKPSSELGSCRASTAHTSTQRAASANTRLEVLPRAAPLLACAHRHRS